MSSVYDRCIAETPPTEPRAERPDAPAARGGRRERKKRETRRRLVDEARRLFEQQGFDGTSVEEITEAADVSRATFFNHFPTKQAVLGVLADEMDGRFEDLVRHERERPGNTAERLARLFAELGKLGRRHPELARQIVAEARFGGLTRRERREHMTRMTAAVEGLLADGLARGDVRDDHPLPVLVDLVAGTYLAVLLDWITTPGYPMAERMGAAARLLAETISAR